MSKLASRYSGLLRLLAFPALALGGGGSAAWAQGPLVSNSPFMPAGGAAVGSAGPAEAYELAGSTVQGKEISVCIFERQAKHSRWIPVGGITDGIHVISFDPERDRAVVAIGGSIKELTMRKPTISSVGAVANAAPIAYSPVAPAAPIASDSPAPARTAAQEQREARMLVSDLLEIGVQQRKAYQEAKQKAASEPPAPSAN